MTEPIPSLGKPTSSHILLCGLILLCSSIDLSQAISLAGVSGLGAATLVAGGAVWALWFIRPVLPRGLQSTLLPLILFDVDAAGTFLWYSPRIQSIQLLVIGLSFLGFMMLTARETSNNPAVAGLLYRWLMVTAVVPLSLYLLAVRAHGLGTTLGLISPRPFGLYAMVIAAVTIACWRGKHWPERPSDVRFGSPVRSFLASNALLIWVGCIETVVALSMSRTALVVMLLLVPLVFLLRGNIRGILIAVLILAAGAGLFAVALSTSQPLYDRFFHEDATMHVGGVAINGSGRTKIWNLLLNNIGDNWLFGKGVSSSEETVDRYFTNIGQPHNDYLRFYYDQGIFGVCLWGWFIVMYVYRTGAFLRQSIRDRSNDYRYHLAALLALTAVSLAMMTDNPVCYTFVMIPLAIVMGCSLGRGSAQARVRDVWESLEPEARRGSPV